MSSKRIVVQLLSHFGIPADQIILTDSKAERLTVQITVPETESGILIGHHGETIDALQTLIALIINHDASVYQPVLVDINSYRQNRLKYLEELSGNAASQAVSSGREIILPPLTSFERRHIHVFLKENPDVQTYSEGEGLNRRLIIRPNK
jgi:spoIIIJ-associated protein